MGFFALAKREFSRGLWTVPVILAFVTLATLVISRPVENVLRDITMSAVSPFTEPADNVLLVTITEDTLQQFPYRSPIDRAFLAGLIEKIAAAGPKVIGVDILFDQATEPEKDARLASALENSPVPIVLASATAENGLEEEQIEYLRNFAPSVPRGLAALGRDSGDGVVRELVAGHETSEGYKLGFSAAMAFAVNPDLALPDSRQTAVFYRTENGEPFAFPAYPAHAAAVLPADWFKDKFVLIGVDLPLDDRHPTPFVALNGVKDGTMPGLAVHAHGLSQIVQGEMVAAGGRIAGGLMFLVGMGLAVWVAWRPVPVLFKPVLIIAVLALMWSLAVFLFMQYGIYMPVVAPSVLVAGIASVVTFLAWRRDSEQRRFLQRAFSQYVSPSVVQSIVRKPEMLRLGGERRTITCVFTDLQGFTSVSEKLAPEEIASVLNDYLDRICNLFVEHGATIDKVIGDAVVGFFGAPTEQPDQADRAVSLALAIDELSEEFRKEMAGKGLRIGATRVGIHSGPAIVGNFGGERFFDYTAIGDTVNTAARLEGANRYIGTRLCVSENTMEAAKTHEFRPSGTIYLKGKTSGIVSFEPLNSNQREQICIKEYRDAFALLQRGDDTAGKAFSRLSGLYPDDGLVDFHHTRLENGEKGADIVLSEK